MARTRSRGAKSFPVEMGLGQRGINLIERIVLEMDCLWTPNSAVDIGIDGTIELVDRDTRRPLNQLLHVQSKATSQQWESETDQEFWFTCRQEDLDYWLTGNAPVLLIVSRPDTQDAFWVSVKDYFRQPATRRGRRIRFDKKHDRFDSQAYERLFRLARPSEQGLYLSPPRRTEQLLSNLLEVRSFSERLYVADASVRTRAEAFGALATVDEHTPHDFVLRDKKIFSFRDLRDSPWTAVADRGTVEDFASAEWSQSDDLDRRREFVELLNLALQEKLYWGRPHVRVSIVRGYKVFYFRATKDLSPRVYTYSGKRGRARRQVFYEVHSHEWEGRTYRIFRHSAMEAQFVRYEGQWLLQIVPTYLFTIDGERLYRKQAQWLSGIKRLERQPAVVGQLLVWADHLQRSSGLFEESYAHLSFGPLREFSLPTGIDDSAWRPWDEVDRAKPREQLALDFISNEV